MSLSLVMRPIEKRIELFASCGVCPKSAAKLVHKVQDIERGADLGANRAAIINRFNTAAAAVFFQFTAAGRNS